jgi:hypothetical protein
MVSDPQLVNASTKWRGRDFAFIMIAGLLIGAAAYLAAFALGWEDDALLVISASAQYAGHLVALVILARRRRGIDSLRFLVVPSDLLYVGLGLGLQVLLPLLFFPLSNLVGDGEVSQAVSDQVQQLGGIGARLAMALVIGVLAPITEELMFRGVLLNALGGFGRRAAITVSALIFAGFHLFGLSGDFLRGAVLTMPTFFVMGVILARVTIRRDRLGPAIFIHSGFNVLALLVLLMPPELFEQLTTPQ